ncbi:biopolymer transporter ExbD [Mangrovimonas sp. DI 80]|uniref:ExbD/TolR family protein n=1 Tax=Mangrovimonas sp. DI 80 TaxID=1779330 RepID=UPI0009764584|nr:biopolymer transporter ExbD [Mangrovimonas sp. DI 80]OMP30770.1 biopolymer transporter ExbD [Mangrovimonas sp. DI 80]
MKTSRHAAPQVNAGSMADIAFLLLIFILVTTTISMDSGLSRKLPPPCPPNTDCNADIKERNILRVMINPNNDILVNEKIVAIQDLKQVVANFIDNNGTKTCDYCHGKSEITSSENPQKAVISLQTAAKTKYEFYIEVQDEITKAYYDLRATYASEILRKPSDNLTEKDLKEVKEAYPFILSEAQTE